MTDEQIAAKFEAIELVLYRLLGAVPNDIRVGTNIQITQDLRQLQEQYTTKLQNQCEQEIVQGLTKIVSASDQEYAECSSAIEAQIKAGARWHRKEYADKIEACKNILETFCSNITNGL